MTAIDLKCRQDIIVVRGDLFSDSGYGRATRALSALLAQHATLVFGISLHEHRARLQNSFDYTVITDADLFGEAQFVGCTVINVCLPDSFIAVPGARNIGYFFWETDQFPLRAFWKAKLALMDEVWAPSHWQSKVLRNHTGRSSIPVIAWPQHLIEAPAPGLAVLGDIRAHAPMPLAELDNYLLRVTPAGDRDLEKLTEEDEHAHNLSHRFDPSLSPHVAELMGRSEDTFLAIQTDAPRKGLPLLLTSWLLFKKTPEGRSAKLIIKMSSIDVTIDMYRLHFFMSLAVRRPMRRLAVQDSGIFFVYDRLSADRLRALTAASDVFVSATMGEGFGGPIAEALLEGIPVVCPYHTSCKDILGPNYPLAVENEPHRMKLWNNIDVYSPASVWNIVNEVSFVKSLRKVAQMTTKERKKLTIDACIHVERAVGAAAVSKALARALDKMAVARRG